MFDSGEFLSKIFSSFRRLKMLQIMCCVNPEDYWYLDSMVENNVPVNYYGYMFKVEGASETSGGDSIVKLIVVELINANISVGFALPENMSIDGEFQLGFISQDNPTRDIPLVCKLSEEVKRATYMGNDIEKLEYIGFTLEQFYQNKGATFYLYDLRGSTSSP
jgi:hypothetical protein